MSMLTYLVDAEIRDNKTTLEGKTLTRPILFLGDALNTTYAVNVDIGEGQIMYDVPVAAGNNELRYAEIGSPVVLTRNEAGRWMVTAFSKVLPGTFTRVPVNVPDWSFGIPEYSLGTIENLGVEVRALTYGELATMGGYGTLAYGAVALYRGGALVEIQ